MHTCVGSKTHARIANVYTASLFTHLHKTTHFYILCPNSAEETYRFDQNGPSLTNHMYWVPSSTSEGEDEVSWEKWASVFQNLHDGHGDHYRQCEHGVLKQNDRQKN
mgnify:CR=1 FL=1